MRMLILIDPGHGMGAVAPHVLDEGVVGYYQGVRVTEQEMALRYAVALDEVLKHQGIRTALTRADGQQNCPNEARLEAAKGADLVISIHFLEGENRGFEIAASPRATDLAWAAWDAISEFLPFRSGPRSVRVGGSILAEHDGLAIEIGLGHLGSQEDLQLITDAYWKVRVCEAIAGAVTQFFAAKAA